MEILNKISLDSSKFLLGLKEFLLDIMNTLFHF